MNGAYNKIWFAKRRAGGSQPELMPRLASVFDCPLYVRLRVVQFLPEFGQKRRGCYQTAPAPRAHRRTQAAMPTSHSRTPQSPIPRSNERLQKASHFFLVATSSRLRAAICSAQNVAPQFQHQSAPGPIEVLCSARHSNIGRNFSVTMTRFEIRLNRRALELQAQSFARLAGLRVAPRISTSFKPDSLMKVAIHDG